MGQCMFIVFLMNVMNIFCKKYIKMENKEQDFINRYKDVQESIVKAMDKALERAIGNKVIDFEKCEGNYLDVYPLIGAVLQKSWIGFWEVALVKTYIEKRRKTQENMQMIFVCGLIMRAITDFQNKY